MSHFEHLPKHWIRSNLKIDFEDGGPNYSLCLDRTGSKQIHMDLVWKSHRRVILFTRDCSGTGPEQIQMDQNSTCWFAGPVLHPFGSVLDQLQMVPRKHLDKFQMVGPCKQKLICSSSVRNGSDLFLCLHSLSPMLHCSHYVIYQSQFWWYRLCYLTSSNKIL